MALSECHGQCYVAARRYAELYANRARHPRSSVILKAAERLHKTRSVLSKKKDIGRQYSVTQKSEISSKYIREYIRA